ncbi:hypothetical protein DNTS_020662 [Danionella cerebrum]|uniref:G-protein coupled receptors family 1 profile domain-containing protein n=1 Tax=Danionella cerebrum TaxID=2873325 RepID=A0A553PZP0_9TELE|nr:hypothetical protein DNTS_020662 [Danionella translucida]
MPENIALLNNSSDLGHVGRALSSSARPAWAIAVLASVLIFTTVVDVLGNLLVIISVFRNRKLRNAARARPACFKATLAVLCVALSDRQMLSICIPPPKQSQLMEVALPAR